MTMDLFIDFLLAYNKKVNLVSRQSTRETLDLLVAETLLLKKLVSAPLIIDAGSGGGLLGIPLAISFPEKKIILTETIQKKTNFLKEAILLLGLGNAKMFEGPIQEFMHRHDFYESTIIARGFPKIEILANYVYEKKVKELLLISSVDKIKKIQNTVANIRQNLYNIPSRNNLIILKLENVSRET
ncbi:MAG: class I SAM-dependent methyltransferase [Candidatus Aminicenantes bacterium]|nr:class I SAM-dependent methyltransferase [Candidatus Aminicenantes bacterium]